VMPYVDGESLRDRLKRAKTLSIAEAVHVARETAAALAYAHRRGIVHRDVKPENILLWNGRAIVADFGIARAIRDAGALKLTVGGMAVGTPTYMSPEQARGSGVDGRSDIYGLGCVLFETLAGRPPFLGTTAKSLVDQHLNTPAPSLSPLRSGVPHALANVVAHALEKDPEERYATAAEMDADLAVLDTGEKAPGSADAEALRVPEAPLPTLVVAPPSVPRTAGPAARWLVPGVLAALATFGLLSWKPWEKRGDAAARATTRFAASIAAMPLDHFGQDAEGGFLSEGLTEETIAQLARIEGLRVISRTSVSALKGKGLTVPQIAERLGVRHVLEGSIQRSGDKIRVTLQLIDAERDAHVWAESYDTDLVDVVRLREEIARKVVSALGPRVGLSPAPSVAATCSRTEICTAYDAYLEGEYWLDRPNRETLAKSVGAFERAIALDERYAPAYAGLAGALRLSAYIGYRGSDPYAEFARAVRLAERAIALDPGLAEAYAQRGFIRAIVGGDPADVAADLKKAVQLVPGSGPFVAASGLPFALEGRYAEALERARAGADLDPLSPALHGGGVAFAALGARKYDVALAEARRALALDPRFESARLIEPLALILLGRARECAALDLASYPEVRALCLRAEGKLQEADALAASVAGPYARGEYTAAFQLGLMSAYFSAAGDGARALDWMGKAFDASPAGIDFRLLDSGLFDGVRKAGPFVSELERMRSRARDRVLPRPGTNPAA
jgi:eukaryotic-like serine/threonine-protein kinase